MQFQEVCLSHKKEKIDQTNDLYTGGYAGDYGHTDFPPSKLQGFLVLVSFVVVVVVVLVFWFFNMSDRITKYYQLLLAGLGVFGYVLQGKISVDCFAIDLFFFLSPQMNGKAPYKAWAGSGVINKSPWAVFAR